MILKNILKKKKENTTQLIELSVNSWLLPLPYISIVVANVDELGQVDHVDCQTLLTNEPNGATYTLPNPNHLVEGWIDPQAGLEKISGRLSNNCGLNSTKPQISGRRRLNKNPAG